MNKKKSPPIMATVQSKLTITPNMQRIIFHSPAFANYPSDSEGGYIKLLFNQQGGTDLSIIPDGDKPLMRTYSIRALDPVTACIEVDMIRHATANFKDGVASHWACSAQIGDTISIQGPGPFKEFSLNTNWFFLVADMTALTALLVSIKHLPKNAKGYAVIEVSSEDDIQPFDVPKGIEVEWIFKPIDQPSSLSDIVKQKNWLEGNPSIWCACEFDSMRVLRHYFRTTQQVAREDIYISSYWKNGVTEDGHKMIKRQDNEENQ